MAEFVPKDVWPNMPRYNKTVRIPHGYKVCDGDSSIFIPDLDQIFYIEQAMDYVDDGNTFAEVADWLTTKLSKGISHSGLRLIWKRHREYQRDNARANEIRKKARERRKLDPEEKKRLQAIRMVAAAKRSLSNRSKKLDAIENPPEDIPQFLFAVKQKPEASVIYNDDDIIFRPNKGPQTDFLAAPEREVLYGGSAGGGKSYGLLADPMRYFHNPNFSGLILRRTTDELRELKWKSYDLYTKAFPGAKWREKDSLWVFPSGARLWLTYLERDEDVKRYQGQSFSYIAVDELTQYATPFAWDYLRSRLRTTDPTLPIFMRATTNPGGVGHGWVKRMFIDPAPANTPFWATDIDTGEVLSYPKNHLNEKLRGKPLFKRRFIPARLSDNPYLYEGGQYEQNLLSLPEMQRRQLLEGDWTIAEGAAFGEFRNAEPFVITPFEVPHNWTKFRSCDYGYTTWSAVHWYAIDPAYETLIVYRELYVTKKTGVDLADLILKAEAGENIRYGILDSSVWQQRGQNGPSIAEEMIQLGCRWRPADRTQGSRVNGKNRLHELLKFRNCGYNTDGSEILRPSIQFFNTCRQIIADLQVIPVDPRGTDDIDDRYASDHAYDSIRYGIMSRPRSNSIFDFSSPQYGSSYTPMDSKFGY